MSPVTRLPARVAHHGVLGAEAIAVGGRADDASPTGTSATPSLVPRTSLVMLSTLDDPWQRPDGQHDAQHEDDEGGDDRHGRRDPPVQRQPLDEPAGVEHE